MVGAVHVHQEPDWGAMYLEYPHGMPPSHSGNVVEGKPFWHEELPPDLGEHQPLLDDHGPGHAQADHHRLPPVHEQKRQQRNGRSYRQALGRPEERWYAEQHLVHAQAPPPPRIPTLPPVMDANTMQMMMLQQQLLMQQAQIANQAGGGNTAQMLQMQMLQAQIAAQGCNNGAGGGSTNIQNCAQRAHQAGDSGRRRRQRLGPRLPPRRTIAVPAVPVLPPVPIDGQWEGWQEATIILCLVIMAGIYMTVNAAATPAKPSSSSSSSRPSSGSSSSRSSSSKPPSSSSKPPNQVSGTIVRHNESLRGYINPYLLGGSMMTITKDTTPAGLGEPVNVIISGNSDPRVLENDILNGGIYSYLAGLGFGGQCFGLSMGNLQGLDTGDGRGIKDQEVILRHNYGDPLLGGCAESIRGGSHVRIWHQITTRAWFWSVSLEKDMSANHDIVIDGYDQGRDYMVGLAVNRPEIQLQRLNPMDGDTFTGETKHRGWTYTTHVTYKAGVVPSNQSEYNHYSTPTENASIQAKATKMITSTTVRAPRQSPKPIKIESLGHLTLIDCQEYGRELLHAVSKAASALVVKQSHKDRTYHTLVWRCIIQCSIVSMLASLVLGYDKELVHRLLELLASSLFTITVTACILQFEGAKLLVKGAGVRRLESLVALAAADVFWSDQDGTLTKKSIKTVRWDISTSLSTFTRQDLEDTTAMAMGSTGFRGIYKERSIFLQQAMRMTPAAMPSPFHKSSSIVAMKSVRNVDSGKVTTFFVADPNNCKDFNALDPRLSTKGLQAMFAGLGLVENARELQSTVRKFFKAGQACHIVILGDHSEDSGKVTTKLRAVGVYPVHSPVLSSARIAIEAVEAHGFKFRLATAASQGYAHLVGGALQTKCRTLITAPLLDSSPTHFLGARADRVALVNKVIDRHSGISRCSRLKGGKALLLKAASEAGYSNVMFGDGFNDVEAMRIAEVSIGAGLHSYWDVLASTDILIGTNTAQQNIISLSDLLHGAEVATSKVIRYLEAVRLIHQILCIIAIATSCACRSPAARIELAGCLLPLATLLLPQRPLSKADLKTRMEFTPWNWLLVQETVLALCSPIRDKSELLARQTITPCLAIYAHTTARLVTSLTEIVGHSVGTNVSR